MTVTFLQVSDHAQLDQLISRAYTASHAGHVELLRAARDGPINLAFVDRHGDLRRTEILPVREHLQPRPRQTPDCYTWVYTRDEVGDLYFASISTERADEMEIEGEA